MEEYASEQEQVDELKKVVRENAPWAIGGVILGGLLYFAYNQYQSWLDQKAHTGSQKYELVIEALSKKDPTAAMKQLTELRNDYARSPFADQAALAIARYDAEAAQWNDAQTLLTGVVEKTHDAALKEVAILRLARVERAMGHRDEALATLAKAAGGRDDAAILEIKGDVLADAGNPSAAREAYTKALSSAVAGIVNKDDIELKLNVLAANERQGKTP